MAGREQAACLTTILYDCQEKKNIIIFLIVVNVLLLLLKFTNKVEEYLSSIVF